MYLSPPVDCHDGGIVAYTAGSGPNAELANRMLVKAVETLPEGAHPLVRSDRGRHCRWPGWLDLMDRYGLAQPRAYQTVTRLDESGTIPSEPGNDCVIISKKTSAACYRYQSPYIDNVLSTIYCDNPRIFDD